MHQQVEYTGCIEKFQGKTALMLPNGTVQFDNKSLEPFCYGWHNVGPRSDFKPITHVVYLFSARWCEPCKKIKQLIAEEGLTDQVVLIARRQPMQPVLNDEVKGLSVPASQCRSLLLTLQDQIDEWMREDA